MTLPGMIAVLQAAAAGKRIECQCKIIAKWLNAPYPAWNFDRYNYRVSPEPREFWLCGGYIYENAGVARAEGDPVIHVREVLE